MHVVVICELRTVALPVALQQAFKKILLVDLRKCTLIVFVIHKPF